MVKDRKILFFLILVLMFLPMLSYAQETLSPTLQAYLDAQSNKEIAQINSKIDQTTNKIQKDLDKEVEEIEKRVEKRLQEIIKGTVRAIAIGISGIIIITLAVFKVVDLKLTSTKKLKRYEDMLKTQNDELKKIILENKRYRDSLKRWHEELQKVHNNFEKTGVIKETIAKSDDVLLKQGSQMTPVPIQKEGKKFNWKLIIIILGILATLGVFGYILTIILR